MFEALLKRPLTGLAAAAGGVLLAPVLLPAAAGLFRPAARALVRLYLELKSEVDQERREFEAYKKRRQNRGALAAHVLAEGAQGLLTGEVEVEAEGVAAESLVEVLGGILG